MHTIRAIMFLEQDFSTGVHGLHIVHGKGSLLSVMVLAEIWRIWRISHFRADRVKNQNSSQIVSLNYCFRSEAAQKQRLNFFCIEFWLMTPLKSKKIQISRFPPKPCLLFNDPKVDDDGAYFCRHYPNYSIATPFVILLL